MRTLRALNFPIIGLHQWDVDSSLRLFAVVSSPLSNKLPEDREGFDFITSQSGTERLAQRRAHIKYLLSSDGRNMIKFKKKKPPMQIVSGLKSFLGRRIHAHRHKTLN